MHKRRLAKILALIFAASLAPMLQAQLQAQSEADAEAGATPKSAEAGVVDAITDAAIEPPTEEALPGLEAYADGLVDEAMAAHRALPGITLSVVKDGQIILLKGYGFADVEKKIPVNPDSSMFRIGSISKTFTGLAVMQLVEQGKLDLDVDVNEYLQAFKIPDTYPEPITLRALISHRDGFEDVALGALFKQKPEELESLGGFLHSHMPNRVRPPGETSTYTNYGMSLAGYIVEVVSGQDYASYMEEHIFRPLQMDHTTVREPLGEGRPDGISADLEPYLVTGYTKGPDGKPKAQPFDLVGQVAPAGAISSSALDMAKYMMARLNDDRYEGGQLVQPETSQRMRQRLYDDRPFVPDMAYAMADNVVEGYQWRWHNGGTTTFFSDMTLYPELGLGIFISTNSYDGGPEVSGQIPKLIFKRYFPSRTTFTAATPPADFAQRGQKYTGTFLMSRRSYTRLEKLIALPGVSTFAVDQDGYLVQSLMGETIKWVETGPGVFQSAEEDPDRRGGTRYLYFYDNDKGEAVRASMPLSDLVRISFWQSPNFFYLGFGLAFLLSLTTLLGAWRRSAAPRKTTSRGGVWAGRFAFLTAICVLISIVCVGMTVAVAVTDPVSLMFNWPTGSLKFGLILILLIIALTVGMLVLLPKAWTGSGWGALRRIHYSVFALACVLLIVAAMQWNMVGFKYF